MIEIMGPKPNTNYLKSAVAQIYGDDDDFIVIGLTGRTGSGCSTVAKILQSKQEQIRHSLFSGSDAHTNEQRKERILLRHFGATWTPFLLLQVRAIITTFLLEQEGSFAAEKFSNLLESNAKRTAFADLLDELRVPYIAIKNGEKTADPIEYYTQALPTKCEELREILGESSFVQLYQIIGKNIRLSGDPYTSTLKEGCFFALAERINSVIKLIHDERKKKRNGRTLS